MDTETMNVLTAEERKCIEEKEQAIEQAGAELEGGTMQSMAMGLKGAELTYQKVR